MEPHAGVPGQGVGQAGSTVQDHRRLFPAEAVKKDEVRSRSAVVELASSRMYLCSMEACSLRAAGSWVRKAEPRTVAGEQQNSIAEAAEEAFSN